MKDIHLQTNYYEKVVNGDLMKGEMCPGRYNIYARRDNTNQKIYHVSIVEIDTNRYFLEVVPMKIVKDEMFKITLEGVSLHDPDNTSGVDFSGHGIQFIANAFGRASIAILWLKTKNTVYTFT